jgi:energy-coupling factor transporter ATP-binding protein EcfA2
VTVAQEPSTPGLVLVDEPDVVAEPDAVLRLFYGALSALREAGHALVVATHLTNVLRLCERQLRLADGPLVSRGDARELYARQARPHRWNGITPTIDDVVTNVDCLPVVDADRGPWLLTHKVRPELMRGMWTTWMLVDPSTKRRLDQRAAVPVTAG